MSGSTIVVLSVFLCFAGILASPLLNDNMSQEMSSCLIGFGVNPDKFSKKSYSMDSEELYCPFACVYKTMGIMKADGTMDMDMAKQETKDNVEEFKGFETFHDVCKEGRVGCGLVKCMFQKLFQQSHDKSVANQKDEFQDQE